MPHLLKNEKKNETSKNKILASVIKHEKELKVIQIGKRKEIKLHLQTKSLPAVQETRVQSLDQKAFLEKEMATHSSIHAWKIPWTEEPGYLCPRGHKSTLKENPLTKPQKIFTCDSP